MATKSNLALAVCGSVDELEEILANDYPQADCPVVHRFTPGLYIRETHIPAGTMGTSMEHKTEHPFVITKGRVRVVSTTEGSVIYEAPYTGITKPGTRRILFAEADTVWTTFHPTQETELDKIAAEILEPHVNPLLEDELRNQWRLANPQQPLIP